jgi:APA family basic amino acid/polyamine antiporter
MAQRELKRVLRLPAVTFIAIGFTIGGGVFVFTGIVLNIVGPALAIAYALAVVPVFISMLPVAMLGSALPTTGANYRYPSRMVSPGLAFVGIWVYALASFVGQIPLYALGCAAYAHVYLPGVPPTAMAVGIVTFVFVINLLGVKLAAQVQGLFVIILISALLYYAGAGIQAMNPEHFAHVFQKGSVNLMLGTALLTFTYLGANGVVELGGEIVNPGKVIPAAFFIAFPVVLIIYTLVAVATVGAAPMGMLSDAEEPLIRICQHTCGRAGVFFFVTGGAVLALITTLNALFIVGTKSLLMMVQDHLLPETLGRLSRRFGTPYVFLTVIWTLSVGGILSGFSLETLAAYAALGGLIIFIPVQIASVKLPVLYPEHYRRAAFKLRGIGLWVCPCLGVLMVVFFSIIILYDLKSLFKVACFAAFVFSGAAYYLWRKGRLRARGLRLEDLMKRQETWIG